MSREDIAIILTFAIVIVLAVICGIGWHVIDHIKSKRPHKNDDEEDNPITKFKDDLADIYENYPNGKLKKLAQAVWNRVEEIEKWHYSEIHDWERKYYSARYSVGELDVKCDGYREELDEWTKRCEELQSKLNESQERLKRESAKAKTLEGETDKLRDMLKEEQEKNKIPLFSCETEVPSYLISENTFGGQINPFAKAILNTKPGEPLTAKEAEEKVKHAIDLTAKPILIDSEELNEKLRNIWQKEAGKAVELPNTVKVKQDDGWIDAIEAARDPDKWPEYMAKVEGVPKGYNKYKVTLYDNKDNETIETELWGKNIYDAMKSVDEERYSVIGYRCVMRNRGWC